MPRATLRDVATTNIQRLDEAQAIGRACCVCGLDLTPGPDGLPPRYGKVSVSNLGTVNACEKHLERERVDAPHVIYRGPRVRTLPADEDLVAPVVKLPDVLGLTASGRPPRVTLVPYVPRLRVHITPPRRGPRVTLDPRPGRSGR